ncbi:hypothetical protein [Nostoc sp.]|uniref:hypothetical protein n=1 Tax=Nostoc sp. TaxID=1180 RepID=UPI002FF57407
MGSHCGGREHLHKGGSVLGGFPDLKQLPSSGVETPKTALAWLHKGSSPTMLEC